MKWRLRRVLWLANFTRGTELEPEARLAKPHSPQLASLAPPEDSQGRTLLHPPCYMTTLPADSQLLQNWPVLHLPSLGPHLQQTLRDTLLTNYLSLTFLLLWGFFFLSQNLSLYSMLRKTCKTSFKLAAVLLFHFPSAVCNSRHKPLHRVLRALLLGGGVVCLVLHFK